MSMHISVIAEHLSGEHDLGYWEGEPPAIGDLIDVASRLCVVEERYWVDHLTVKLVLLPLRDSRRHGNRRRGT